MKLSRVVLSSKLGAQTIEVYRSIGAFEEGRWVEKGGSPLNYMEIKGIIYPSTEKELQQVPEGDRIRGAVTFLTVEPLYVTRTTPEEGISDKIKWNGEVYKIVSSLPWKDYGYYASVGERMAGE